MSKFHLIQKMKEAGFALYRAGTKHDLYSNGKEIISLSRGNKTSPNTLRSFEKKLRRAKETITKPTM